MDLSPGAVVASFLVGTVGLGFFLYGKKQSRLPQLATGIALMACPYFSGGAVATMGIGAALTLAGWIAIRSGL